MIIRKCIKVSFHVEGKGQKTLFFCFLDSSFLSADKFFEIGLKDKILRKLGIVN